MTKSAKYRIRVVDIETIGLAPDSGICEIGWTDLESEDGATWSIRAPVCILTNPGRPIPPEAMAVHHITNRMIADAPHYSKEIGRLREDGITLYAAHNAAFEMGFLGDLGKPFICTYKVALRLWPEAPGHGNQVLRYWLDLENKCENEFCVYSAQPPHRAGPDSYVTAFILREQLQRIGGKQAVRWSREPAMLPRVTFGKYRGSRWEDVPTEYLVWLAEKATEMSSDVVETAKAHLAQRSNGRAQTAPHPHEGDRCKIPASILSDPLVMAVMDRFPGAEIVDVRRTEENLEPQV